MTRHPTRNNLRKEGLEDAAVTVGRAWWQWCEVAGPLPSVVRKERERKRRGWGWCSFHSVQYLF